MARSHPAMAQDTVTPDTWSARTAPQPRGTSPVVRSAGGRPAPGLRLPAHVLQAVREGVRTVVWTVAYGTRFALTGLRGGTREQREVRRAAVVRSYLLRMGPLYMKAGQVLATQS